MWDTFRESKGRHSDAYTLYVDFYTGVSMHDFALEVRFFWPLLQLSLSTVLFFLRVGCL